MPARGAAAPGTANIPVVQSPRFAGCYAVVSARDDRRLVTTVLFAKASDGTTSRYFCTPIQNAARYCFIAAGGKATTRYFMKAIVMNLLAFCTFLILWDRKL